MSPTKKSVVERKKTSTKNLHTALPIEEVKRKFFPGLDEAVQQINTQSRFR